MLKPENSESVQVVAPVPTEQTEYQARGGLHNLASLQLHEYQTKSNDRAITPEQGVPYTWDLLLQTPEQEALAFLKRKSGRAVTGVLPRGQQLMTLLGLGSPAQ